MNTYGSGSGECAGGAANDNDSGANVLNDNDEDHDKSNATDHDDHDHDHASTRYGCDDASQGHSNGEADQGSDHSMANDRSHDDDDESELSGSEDSGESIAESVSSEKSYSEEEEESSSDDSSYSSTSSSDSSYESTSDDDGSHDSSMQESQSRSQHSNSSRNNSEHNTCTGTVTDTAPIANIIPSKYSPNRTFHQGVLPIVSHGLSLQPYRRENGDYNGAVDPQNCDANRSLLIHRKKGRNESLTVDGNGDGDASRSRRDLPQCRPDDDDCDDDRGDKQHHSRQSSSSQRHRRNDNGSRHKQKKKSKSKKNATTKTINNMNCCIKYLFCRIKKRSTQIFLLSFTAWIFAQCYYFYYWSLKDFFVDKYAGGDLYNDYISGSSTTGNSNMNSGGQPQPQLQRRRQEGMMSNDRERKKMMAHHSHHDHHDGEDHFFNDHHTYAKRTPTEMDALRYQRTLEAQAALGTAAGDAMNDFDYSGYKRNSGGKPLKVNNNKIRNNNNNNKIRKGSRDPEGGTRTERLRDGCSNLEWHSYHFPNCNEVHEIDLRSVVGGYHHGGNGGGDGSSRHHGRQSRRPKEDMNEASTRTRQSRRQKHDVVDNDSSIAMAPNTPKWGFVGAGLWRDVFSCDPRDESSLEIAAADSTNTTQSPIPPPPAVLKIMKSEHPYNSRNFHRHRRDALVMERLGSSHHLVAIYGYCANTVLTQAISHTLDDVIYARQNERVKKWSPHGGYKTKPPLESWMGRDDDSGELLATRETELGRIKLALGVFRGLMDLHEGDAGTTGNGKEWLPIVHADLQSKQYLVDATTGRVYLNDFNRCRFLTKKDPLLTAANNYTKSGKDNDIASSSSNSNSSVTLESCPLYVPTAPGAARSPEEYSMSPLSEKLDIYSAGNIFYGIITGEKPWNDERGKHVKAGIQRGDRPKVNETMRNGEEGVVDAELVRLLDRVYEHDPEKRASAREIVEELERLLEKTMESKKVSLQKKGEEEGRTLYTLEEHLVVDEQQNEEKKRQRHSVKNSKKKLRQRL